MAVSKDGKAVKEIINRYGATLDLKSSPHVIVEIIRQYGPVLGGVAASCAPPGGPPKVHDPSNIIKELRSKMAEISQLSTLLERAIVSKPSAKKKPT